MHLPIYESQAKRALLDYLGHEVRVAEITDLPALDSMIESCPWLLGERLAAKPDLLLGKRGKNGLIVLDKSFDEIKEWIRSQWGKDVFLNGKTAVLNRVLVEPYVEHVQTEEHYFCIRNGVESDLIHLSAEGGVEIESHWDNVKTFEVDLEHDFDLVAFIQFVKENFSGTGFDSDSFFDFIGRAHEFFVDFGFVYLEMNPLVFRGGSMHILDVKSRLDSAEEWRCGEKWGKYFQISNQNRNTNDKKILESENKVREIDALTGSSLKLDVLNPNGSIWPLVAGGGASVLVADAVVARGLGGELGFYGEYSGNPDQALVEEYADIVIRLMLEARTDRKKILLIMGGIANFTDVAKTFSGIIKALERNADEMKRQSVRVYVRRGGPNYKKGLELMKEPLDGIGLVNEVHGPEIGLTEIIV